jgi:hypothetical protein
MSSLAVGMKEGKTFVGDKFCARVGVIHITIYQQLLLLFSPS